MIVQMTGSGALALLMREDRRGSEHLAPAQVDKGGEQHHRAEAEAEPQRRLGPPRFGGQHIHRHLPREEDALFR